MKKISILIALLLVAGSASGDVINKDRTFEAPKDGEFRFQTNDNGTRKTSGTITPQGGWIIGAPGYTGTQTINGNLDVVGDLTKNGAPLVSSELLSAPTKLKAISNWVSRHAPADNNWKSVVWSSELGLFVAVSDSGTGTRVMTSPDGTAWAERASAIDSNWQSVTWSKELGLFVAVANTGTASNRVMTSSNGLTWVARTSFAENWASVTWSKELGLFMAMGTNAAMTSPDGTNWTLRTVPLSDWASVTWSPEKSIFVAVAWNGASQIITSPDGINWATRTAPSASQWWSVTWSPDLGLFVSVALTGSGSNAMTSPDGTNWTLRTTPSNQWTSVVWSKEFGVFVAVSDSNFGSGRIMTSPDGTNWTSRTAASESHWKAITWAPELGIFVSVASIQSGTRVMTSSLVDRYVTTSNSAFTTTTTGYVSRGTITQGGTYPSSSGSVALNKNVGPKVTMPSAITAVTNWTAVSTNNTNNWGAITWSPELRIFAAVSSSGSGNRVMTSHDGVHWLTRVSSEDNTWVSIAWSKELTRFVAVANTGTNRIMYSSNGITWTPANIFGTVGWASVVWASELNLFVAVGNISSGQKVMTSPDGISWTSRNSINDGQQWNKVTWSPELGLFVAVSFTGAQQVMLSKNGINWFPALSTPATKTWLAVTWSRSLGLFVVTSANAGAGNTMTSPDGYTWTAGSTGVGDSWGSVTWVEDLGIFVAIAYNNNGATVISSPDGTTWTTREITTQASEFAWSADLGKIVLVGAAGVRVSQIDQPAKSHNFLMNGGMTFNQRNPTAAGTNVQWVGGTGGNITNNLFVADRWRLFRGNPTDLYTGTWVNPSYSSGQHPHPLAFNVGNPPAIKIQRPAADSITTELGVTQVLSIDDTKAMQGKSVSLSFYAKRGAHFSGLNNWINAQITYTWGTTTESRMFPLDSLSLGGAGSTTNTKVVALTSVWERHHFANITIPPNVTQVQVIFKYNPIGVAGAADSFDLTHVMLNEGGPTDYAPYGGSLAADLLASQKYFYVDRRDPLNINEQFATNLTTKYTTTTLAVLTVAPPTPFRRAPTITLVGVATTNWVPTNLTGGTAAGTWALDSNVANTGVSRFNPRLQFNRTGAAGEHTQFKLVANPTSCATNTFCNGIIFYDADFN